MGASWVVVVVENHDSYTAGHETALQPQFLYLYNEGSKKKKILMDLLED